MEKGAIPPVPSALRQGLLRDPARRDRQGWVPEARDIGQQKSIRTELALGKTGPCHVSQPQGMVPLISFHEPRIAASIKLTVPPVLPAPRIISVRGDSIDSPDRYLAMLYVLE